MARMQGKTSSEDYQYFAGVDVSKAHLDLCVAGTPHGVRFANDDGGISALLAALEGPHLVVFEPTGRYHLALWRALEAAGHGPVPYNPGRVRHLAEGLGFLAKTDRIDALLLCGIARQQRPAPTPAPDDRTMEIKALHAAPRAAIRRRAMVRTQAKDNPNALVQSLLATEIATLTAQVERLKAALLSLFKARAATRRKHEILTSIPGIGDGAALAILTELPEIGTASRGEIAALAGCAPMTRESGQWKGRARTKGGRRSLRAALHMPAIVAMSRNPDLKAFADRLRQRGKNIFAVITATLRKLLVLANTLVAENRTWTPQKP